MTRFKLQQDKDCVGWVTYRIKDTFLWFVSLFSKCNDKHITQPGAGLLSIGTICSLVEMGNLQCADVQSTREFI